MIHSERIFARAFRQYVDEQCGPDAIERRVSKIIAVCKLNASAQGVRLTNAQVEAMKANISRRMADTHPMFEEYRKRFFMIDTCPENDDRFPLTYEETLGLK